MPYQPDDRANIIYPPVPGTTFAIPVFEKDEPDAIFAVDLSAYAGRYLTIRSQCFPLFLLFASSQEAAEALDPDAREGDTRCYAIPYGEAEQYVIFAATPWLGFRCVSPGLGAKVLRAHISSPPIRRIVGGQLVTA